MMPHTIKSRSGEEGFDSGTMTRSGAYSHTFEKTGTFAYACELHPSMAGTIIVK